MFNRFRIEEYKEPKPAKRVAAATAAIAAELEAGDVLP
jgi:hypothetical protein